MVKGKTSGNHKTVTGTIIKYMLLQSTFKFPIQQKEIINECTSQNCYVLENFTYGSYSNTTLNKHGFPANIFKIQTEPPVQDVTACNFLGNREPAHQQVSQSELVIRPETNG